MEQILHQLRDCEKQKTTPQCSKKIRLLIIAGKRKSPAASAPDNGRKCRSTGIVGDHGEQMARFGYLPLS